ncbi:MAG: carboxypeptidase-like regulatory domain-containing protein, partial [Chitinophagaceae bacterium]
MKNKIYLLVITLFLFTLQSFSQLRNKVTGTVKDNSNKAIAAVTIALLKAKDSSLVKADVSDKSGAFEIATNATGKFLLSYTMIGFEKKYSTIFELQDGKSITMPLVSLDVAAAKLQDVSVTSRKPMIEIKADKTVFNVENSINATGSNALEL